MHESLQRKSRQNKSLQLLLCRVQVINPHPHFFSLSLPHSLSPLLPHHFLSQSLYLVSTSCVQISVTEPPPPRLTSCSVTSKSLILLYLIPFPGLPAHLPLASQTSCLPYEQSSLQVLSCVALLVRLQSAPLALFLSLSYWFTDSVSASPLLAPSFKERRKKKT